MAAYDLRRWLRPSHLPCLKTLAVTTSLQDSATQGGFLLDDILYRGALPTLTCIQVHGAPLSMSGKLAHGAAPLVLFYSPSSLPALPRHSIQQPWIENSTSTVVDRLVALVRQLPTTRYRGETPHVLFVPDLVGAPTGLRLRSVEPELVDLEQACRQRGVRLLRYKVSRAALTAERLEPPVEVDRYVRQLKAAAKARKVWR